MMFPRLYLCGPMTGLPAFNYPAFNAAAVALRQVGFLVFSPTENGLPANAPWDRHMRVDLAELVRCHAPWACAWRRGRPGSRAPAPLHCWGPPPASQPLQPLGAST